MSNKDKVISQANDLAMAFNKIGLKTKVYTYNPVWRTKNKKPKTVTVCEVLNLTDADGYNYEFTFSHDTGKIMTDNDFY